MEGLDFSVVLPLRKYKKKLVAVIQLFGDGEKLATLWGPTRRLASGKKTTLFIELEAKYQTMNWENTAEYMQGKMLLQALSLCVLGCNKYEES